MLTYNLFKMQSMPLSASSRKGQPDPDLHAVQNPDHALVSYKQGKARYLQTYKLFINFENTLLSASEVEFKQNINLHSVYNQRTSLLTSS
jgi:hypothetical protein